MIEAIDFLRVARRAGFDFITGTPCSFLKPLINAAIDDADLRYVSAVNEGDAVAMACGAAMAGIRGMVMFQNSGLGNAVNALTSLAYPCRIPLLLLVTHRGDPAGTPDEPQHEQMGKITVAMLDLLEIAWKPLPSDGDEFPAAMEEAIQHMDDTGRPFAFVVSKECVVPQPLTTVQDHGPIGPRAFQFAETFTRTYEERATRADVIRAYLARAQSNDVVVATTGYTGRELYSLGRRPNHFYMVGSMGSASAVALGMALFLPGHRLVVLDGDGAALMRMGNIAAVGAIQPAGFVHLVLDNEVHDSTGGQATLSRTVSFAAVAQACAYANVLATDDLAELDRFLAAPPTGTTLVHFKTKAGTLPDLGRPALRLFEVKEQLMAHLRES